MRATLRLALAAGVLITLVPLGVGAEQVNNWREGANYPAQITAIPIGGNKLTPNNSVRIGAWTVSLTHRPVVAKYNTERGCNFISSYTGEPDGLVCSNPIAGRHPCAFIAHLNARCVNGSDNTRGPQCYFFVYSEDGASLHFSCPSNLGLN